MSNEPRLASYSNAPGVRDVLQAVAEAIGEAPVPASGFMLSTATRDLVENKIVVASSPVAYFARGIPFVNRNDHIDLDRTSEIKFLWHPDEHDSGGHWSVQRAEAHVEKLCSELATP